LNYVQTTHITNRYENIKHLVHTLWKKTPRKYISTITYTEFLHERRRSSSVLPWYVCNAKYFHAIVIYEAG